MLGFWSWEVEWAWTAFPRFLRRENIELESEIQIGRERERVFGEERATNEAEGHRK